jgi:hypothetical protein
MSIRIGEVAIVKVVRIGDFQEMKVFTKLIRGGNFGQWCYIANEMHA